MTATTNTPGLGGQPENPELWTFLTHLAPGQRLPGTIAAIERFGVFVRVAEGVEGLIRRRDLADEAGHPRDLQVGDQLTVTVAELDLPRRRIAFSAPRD
ncbi:S1 RNA-binding domain-containing protein [Phytomonospora sp. NPDC050363]|uniref:S1 RNA-binding domain-containing protein n=1 Tax=Phytomonospora sp. NPDC050363 TaxID=3155642 RepID=UPI003403B474